MIRIITFLKVFLKKVDFSMSQINVPKASPQEFSKNTCHYCPEAIMKKFVMLTCIVIGLKVLDDGPLFFGIAHCQERGSIVCKHRRTEEAKTKVYIFVYKIFTNSIFKSYTTIAMGFHALAK